MSTLNELRAKFAAREKSVTLITDGAALADHEALTAQLADSVARARPDVRDLAEQVTALETAIAASAVTFRLRGIGRNQFNRLLAEHPAEGKQFNQDTFPVALIAACSLDPVLTVADAESLADVLTDGQWDDVFDAAWDACREVDGIPFNALASAAVRA